LLRSPSRSASTLAGILANVRAGAASAGTAARIGLAGVFVLEDPGTQRLRVHPELTGLLPDHCSPSADRYIATAPFLQCGRIFL
jgi:hypothetical protein